MVGWNLYLRIKWDISVQRDCVIVSIKEWRGETSAVDAVIV